MEHRGVLQGAQADAPVRGLHRLQRERGEVAGLDRASRPHAPALREVPVHVDAELRPSRRDRARRDVAGDRPRRDADPLWDSRTREKAQALSRTGVFQGVRGFAGKTYGTEETGQDQEIGHPCGRVPNFKHT